MQNMLRNLHFQFRLPNNRKYICKHLHCIHRYTNKNKRCINSLRIEECQPFSVFARARPYDWYIFTIVAPKIADSALARSVNICEASSCVACACCEFSENKRVPVSGAWFVFVKWVLTYTAAKCRTGSRFESNTSEHTICESPTRARNIFLMGRCCGATSAV